MHANKRETSTNKTNKKYKKYMNNKIQIFTNISGEKILTNEKFTVIGIYIIKFVCVWVKWNNPAVMVYVKGVAIMPFS